MICELTGARGLERVALRRGDRAGRGREHGARRHGRDRVLVSGGGRPTLRRHARARTGGVRGTSRRSSRRRTGGAARPSVGADVAAVVVQHPNVFGILEPARDLFGAAHDGRSARDPGVRPALARRARAAGGARRRHRRRRGPGPRQPPELRRPVPRDRSRRGWTTSAGCRGGSSGRRSTSTARTGYVLTLQAREQHIRREKANVQHLHEPDADGRRRHDLPGVARARGARRARPAVRGEGRATPPSGSAAIAGRASCCIPRRPSSRSSPSRLPRPAARSATRCVERGFLAGVPLAAMPTGDALLVASPSADPARRSTRFAQAFAEVLA